VVTGDDVLKSFYVERCLFSFLRKNVACALERRREGRKENAHNEGGKEGMREGRKYRPNLWWPHHQALR
jgi:hypothetical protein